MKNPKPAGARASSHKTTSSSGAGASDGRKPHWESSKHPPSDPNPPKEDIPGPSSGPKIPPPGPTHPSSTLPPPALHHLSAAAAAASSPPPHPPYGFHNLERRTIVLSDGTARSYFALPPDYPLDSRPDKFFHPESFRDPPPPFPRAAPADYWSSLALEAPAGSSSLKRKYGEEEFGRHRQNPMGFSSGPIGDGLGRGGSPSRKQIKAGGEGYDELPSRRGAARAEGGEALVVGRDADQKAVKEAFLRLSKIINESPTHRKNYLEDGKNGTLQCVVCRRSGKEFADVHGLIMHAYNSQNSELRIEHLGLHKALCVMLGWNHAKAPDNSKEYQSLTADDARANREDLILWPPTVIIHNTSTGKRKDGRMEGLGNKEMDVKLKELGFGGGKAKSVYGKDGHLGFTAVKFANTEVGLREAENLAEFFEKDNRGRRGWARVQASQSGNNEEKNPDLVKVDKKTGEKNRVFYGYLATSMDLDKIEFDMKKKVVIKSRKELDFD